MDNVIADIIYMFGCVYLCRHICHQQEATGFGVHLCCGTVETRDLHGMRDRKL